MNDGIVGVNRFRNNKNDRNSPITDVDAERLKIEESRRYNKKRALNEHNKLDAIFASFEFNVPFNERLYFRIIGGRVGIILYFMNMQKDKGRYLNDPVKYDDAITRILPLWEKLKIWCRGQGRRRNCGDKFAELTFSWDSDVYDMEESGICNVIEFVVLIRQFFKRLNELRAHRDYAFGKELGTDFNMNISRRRYEAPKLFKYVCNNAFITSKFNITRAFEDDKTAMEILNKLAQNYGAYKITCERFGARDLSKKVSQSLLLTSSGLIDIKWLQQNLRKAAGQKVYWVVFEANPPQRNREKWSNATKLREFDEKNVVVGVRKPILWDISDSNYKQSVLTELSKQFKVDKNHNILLTDWKAIVAKWSDELSDYKHAVIEDIMQNLNIANCTQSDDEDGKEENKEKQSVAELSGNKNGKDKVPYFEKLDPNTFTTEFQQKRQQKRQQNQIRSPLQITFQKPATLKFNSLTPSTTPQTPQTPQPTPPPPPLTDQYTVIFESEPVGMTWTSRNSDQKNLYVTKIEENTPAYYKNVLVGSKLLKFENQLIENLGALNIFWLFKNNYLHRLPLQITFQKPATLKFNALTPSTTPQTPQPTPPPPPPPSPPLSPPWPSPQSNASTLSPPPPPPPSRMRLISVYEQFSPYPSPPTSETVIDFSIFDNHDAKCKINGDADIINNCLSLKRLINALRYYQSLNTRTNKKAQSAFIEFITLKYKVYLDDIIHLTSIHEQDLEYINKALLPEDYFGHCDINKCSLAARHCNIKENISENKAVDDTEMEPLFLFYQDTFDTLHYYLLHLFETGLRIAQLQPDGNVMRTELTDEKEKETETCSQFLNNKLLVSANRKKLAQFFDRFLSKNEAQNLHKQASKFNITSLFDVDDEATFIDGLYEAMQIADVVSDNEQIHALSHYLNEEEFDSEALVADVSNVIMKQKASNVLSILNSKTYVNVVYGYVQEKKLKGSAFNTGFIFWYWPYYATSDDNKHNYYEHRNYNDFGGYTASQLYIARGKYGNLKQEILNNNDNEVGIHEYNDMVYLKARQYMDTDKVKSIFAAKCVYLYYGIDEYAPLHLAHLMALILYCDFSRLCSSFSKTFRKTKTNETLESVRYRNKKYWWMSKLLREAVNYYGINNEGDDYVEYETGPFFCGMDRVMILPCFAMRLCGPTSTTRQQQVALNFADEKGMILQLNNKYGGGGKYLRFFDVSWISRYKEEDERIFIGGTHLIQVESITLTCSMENFQIFFNCLYWFNAAIDGAELFGMKKNFNKKALRIISSLFAQNNRAIHSYILDTFNVFIFNKKTIVLNMDYLSRQCPQYATDLIFDSFVGGVRDKNKRKDAYKDVNTDSNLLRPQLLNTFTATTNIVIYCTNGEGDKSYIFSLCALLKVLSSFKTRKIKCVLNGVWKKTPTQHNNYDEMRSWLYYTYKTMSSSQRQPDVFSSSVTETIDLYYGYKQDTLTFQCL